MNIKKNLPLIVALAIPLVLTAIIAASIYLPGVGKDPRYDFVYTVYDYNTNTNSFYFDIVDGKIVQQTGQQFQDKEMTMPSYGPSSQLYLYDIETDTSKLLTMDDAVKLTVDPSITSPDGYRLEYGNSNGMLSLFGGNYENNQYLLGNNRRIKTSISGYDNNFLGWVIGQ